MISVVISGSSSAVLSPGRGHCVTFLGKTLKYSHIMGTNKRNAGGNPAMD